MGRLPELVQRLVSTRSRLAVWGAFAVCGALVMAVAYTTPALAAHQFTIDSQADSFGPIVVDQHGNGYVAWLRRGGPSGDIDMFCKLAPGARRCAHTITLPVTTYAQSSTDTPFPVLGPGSEVFVVAPAYASRQDVMWKSTNGGVSFGAPYVGPTNSQDQPHSPWTDVCAVGVGLDDVIPFNAAGGQYDRSQGTSTLGGSAIYFAMSSTDPGAIFGFDYYGQGCAVISSSVPANAGPGAIPYQWFGFGGDLLVDQTTLGWAGGGSAACAQVAPGDEVEVYQTAYNTPTIRFYSWSAPTGPCSMGPENLSPGGEDNWSGPNTVTDGEYPRLSGGEAGLFLLTGNYDAAAGAPSQIDIRKYSPASHSFASPEVVSRISSPSELEANSGGLGENFTTGELAAVWPNVKGDNGLMSLFISTDGGKRFSAAIAIGRVGDAYGDQDNARVAVARNGTGFVTWEDGAGLHVADLEPIAAAYKHLVLHHSTVEVPVTCEAPKGRCKVIVRITHGTTLLGLVEARVRSGETKTVGVPLTSAGESLLSAAHGHLKARLTLTTTHPVASRMTLRAPVLIVP